jgi:hypothetical protein
MGNRQSLSYSRSFPIFYGTRRSIAVFTIQSIQLNSIALRSILILYSHLHLGLGLPSCLFLSGEHYMHFPDAFFAILNSSLSSILNCCMCKYIVADCCLHVQPQSGMASEVLWGASYPYGLTWLCVCVWGGDAKYILTWLSNYGGNIIYFTFIKFWFCKFLVKNRGSVVGKRLATGWTTEELEFESRYG